MHPGTALDGCFAFFFCDDGVQGSIREWRVWGPLTHYVREEGSEQERRATSSPRQLFIHSPHMASHWRQSYVDV
jgi:hypothetical protein